MGLRAAEGGEPDNKNIFQVFEIIFSQRNFFDDAKSKNYLLVKSFLTFSKKKIIFSILFQSIVHLNIHQQILIHNEGDFQM